MAESYKDPFYDKLDDQVTRQLGLPSGLLSNIRLKGEKSNASQVSEAGAKSVYQIIPATRDAVLKKYGVDAYESPEKAALAAGHLLKESLDRNKGNAKLAVREYHGGTNPKNWGKINEAYAGRVMGSKSYSADELIALAAKKFPVAKQKADAPKGMNVTVDQLLAAANAKFPKGGAKDEAQDQPQKRGILDELGRQAQLTGRAAIEGIADVGGIVYDPIAATINAVTPDSMGYIPSLSARGEQLADTLGLAKPESDTEKLVQQASKAIVGAGGTIGAGKSIAGAAPMAAEFLAAQPVAQAVASAGAAGGAEATRQAGGGEAAQLAAGLVGGLAPAAGMAAGQGVAKLAGTATGQEIARAAERAAAPVKSAMARTLEKTSGLAAGAKSKVGGAVGSVADRIAPKAKVDLPPSVAESKKQAEMVGVGAASTAAENQRRALLASQGFEGDIAPTRGQLTQDPMVQAFESDISKLPEGEQVAIRMARQNEAIDNKFNQVINATEKEAGDLYDTGEMVVGALGNIEKKAKAEVNAAYDAARAAGDLDRPVPVKAIDDVLNESASAEGNVGVIGATRRELERLRTLEPERGGVVGAQNRGEGGYYRGANERAGQFAWATKDKELAAEYAKGSGGDVWDVFVDVKNPVDFGSDTRRLSPRAFFSEVSGKSDKSGINSADVMKARKAFLDHFGGDDLDIVDFWKDKESQKITADLINSLGFDGVKLKEGIRGVETIASTRSGVKEAANTGDLLTINQLEELRKFVGKNASTPADFAYAGEIKRAIDSVLDQAASSGEYKTARGIYKKYADTFKNRTIVADLLKNKRNTTDRLVAMENVMSRTMLGGSRDDIVHLRSVLSKGGDDGAQAWRELKGALLEHIKEKATLTAKQGESASISPAQLSKQIKSLDKSRKLDTIFGKKDAQNLRDFAEAVNVLRVPQVGTVNTSGTNAAAQRAARQSAGMAADIAATFMLTGQPMPALTVAKFGIKRLRDAETYKRISESLKYSERF